MAHLLFNLFNMSLNMRHYLNYRQVKQMILTENCLKLMRIRSHVSFHQMINLAAHYQNMMMDVHGYKL